MNISRNWLAEYIDLHEIDTQEMADMLTFAGVEVEGMQQRGVNDDLVVVAQVVQKTPVEGSDHLNVCMVDAGEGSLRQIVAVLRITEWATRCPALCPARCCQVDGRLRKVR